MDNRAETEVDREETPQTEAEESDRIGQQESEETELKTLREELDRSQAQAAEYLDGWQRTRAEFSNFRKRQETERAQIVAFANAGLVRKLLPVNDDFDRAIASVPDDVSESGWSEGILLIKRKLESVLESEGVLPIETEGKDFDPRYHEAVTYEEVEGFDEGQIVGVIQQGFMLGDQVLRPALVRVAKAPATLTNTDDTDSDDKE
ncbi:MAG: nucleotide exchange factor GrpE [Chloroflexi bacterium]|nr:nucleotide exchange factor GrpE [Chloroflexota bacterium]